jgi:hypothetical protein
MTISVVTRGVAMGGADWAGGLGRADCASAAGMAASVAISFSHVRRRNRISRAIRMLFRVAEPGEGWALPIRMLQLWAGTRKAFKRDTSAISAPELFRRRSKYGRALAAFRRSQFSTRFSNVEHRCVPQAVHERRGPRLLPESPCGVPGSCGCRRRPIQNLCRFPKDRQTNASAPSLTGTTISASTRAEPSPPHDTARYAA